MFRLRPLDNGLLHAFQIGHSSVDSHALGPISMYDFFLINASDCLSLSRERVHAPHSQSVFFAFSLNANPIQRSMVQRQPGDISSVISITLLSVMSTIRFAADDLFSLIPTIVTMQIKIPAGFHRTEIVLSKLNNINIITVKTSDNGVLCIEGF